jgi:hypothetical protein
VEVRVGTLENPAAAPGWTVTVQAAVKARFTGAQAWAAVGTELWASQTADRLRAAGFEPVVTRIPWPDYSDTPRGLMGVRVRIGSYPTQDATRRGARRRSPRRDSAMPWSGPVMTPTAGRRGEHQRRGH